MTRKDFVLIAQAVRECGYLTDSVPPMSAERARGIIATELADVLRRTNERFDRARFLTACGVQS